MLTWAGNFKDHWNKYLFYLKTYFHIFGIYHTGCISAFRNINERKAVNKSRNTFVTFNNKVSWLPVFFILCMMSACLHNAYSILLIAAILIHTGVFFVICQCEETVFFIFWFNFIRSVITRDKWWIVFWPNTKDSVWNDKVSRSHRMLG